MAIAVFGYGSLVDAGSAAATLGRAVEGVRPARLLGWRRRFSQARENLRCEKTFARAEDGSLPEYVLGLNVERCDEPAQAPNGGLIEVGEAELERLDLREIRYDRADVSTEVEPADGGELPERIMTFVAKPRHFAPNPLPGAVILASYARAVEAAFERFGPGQGEEYRRTTLPYPVEVIEARLVADRIPPGNPREW